MYRISYRQKELTKMNYYAFEHQNVKNDAYRNSPFLTLIISWILHELIHKHYYAEELCK